MSATFGDLVRRGREQAGLSQARLAELVGKSASTIRAWEQGRTRPGDAQVVSAVAAVLGVDEEDMLGKAGFGQRIRAARQSGMRELSNLASERTEMLALRPAGVSRGDGSADKPKEDVARVSVDQVAGTTELDARRAVTTVTSPRPVLVPTVVPRSYLEDESERQFYRRRTVITAAVLVLFVIVALWALGRTGEAIGDFFDDLMGQLNI
jgi:transcriptional regulator with XRE-family HTH domain